MSVSASASPRLISSSPGSASHAGSSNAIRSTNEEVPNATGVKSDREACGMATRGREPSGGAYCETSSSSGLPWT